MYVAPEPVLKATDILWHFLRDFLTRAGVPDVPEELDRVTDYRDVWLHPDLLLSQTCGFPFVKSLRGKVRFVATPCYDHAGCDGSSMRSFVIVNRHAGLSTLNAVRGGRAAINSRDSNSGYNLFRSVLAPVAGGASFFGEIIETGGHEGSIAAVGEGRADCAAIDCITYGNMARYSPARLKGIAILAETPSGPGLPLITKVTASDGDVEVLRMALRAAIVAPELVDARARLGLVDFAFLNDGEYDRLIALEQDAAALGYNSVA